MKRLNVVRPGVAENAAASLHRDLERRAFGGPVGQCPIDQLQAFLQLSHTQTCGKCTPCRIGLTQIVHLLEEILEGRGKPEDVETIRSLAENMRDSADCILGTETADMVLRSLDAYHEDLESHIGRRICAASSERRVPCVESCPAHVDIPGYVALVREGRYEDAVKLIRKDNPFPVACAYICEHPCEGHCRRVVLDAPVNICGIKRYAVDHVENVEAPEPAPATGKKVAVVGGGPAGLSAAYFLTLMGHSVTLYEQRDRLGGMIRYGIPAYRLPRRLLDRDIEVCTKGVEVHTNTSLGKDITLKELRAHNDAIYIAIGAHADKKLGIEGDDAPNVLSAVQILRGIGDEEYPDFSGKRVAVIGGGNVAMDCARTSLRLGAKSVSIIYRRRQIDMTALVEEVDSAVAEGCELVTLQAPARIEKNEAGEAVALWMQPQMIGPVDKSGRPRPMKANKPEERLEADVIIVAIGQVIDSHYLGAEGLPLKWDVIAARDDASFAEMKGVYAGGDCVSSPATVIRAIEAGKVGAANIDLYLGYHHKISVDIDMPAPTFKDTAPCGRVNITEIPAEDRRRTFDLCSCGMSEEEAAQETGRCLMCDYYGYGRFKGGREHEW